MTSETHAKQPSKRFSKLDAIPRHKPVRGLKAAVARIYIARKATMSLVSVAALAIVAGILLANRSAPTDPLEVAVAELAKPTETAIPEEIAQAAGAAKIERIGDDLATKKTDEAEVSPSPAAAKSASAFGVRKADEKELASNPDTEEKSEIRKIIPVAEGLDLYRSTESMKKPPEETVALPLPAADFSLPSAGVPTEDDMADFLRQPEAAVGEVAVIPPAEDLSPTIRIPDNVPVPAARPVQELAKGTKVEFHIVQGQGVKSGFWLGNKEDPTTRRFFVVVSPQLENGETANWKFTNIADGTAADTNRMAVEVTEEAFIALAKESKEFGKVRNPVLGRGEIGDRNVKWRIASVGGNLIAGWDRETRK